MSEIEEIDFDVSGEPNAVTVIKHKDVEVVQDFVPDIEPVIVAVEDEMSNLTVDEIKNTIHDIKNGIEAAYWKLCKYLYYVNKKRIYETWYPTFNDFVEKELAFQKTKARYLVQIWELLYIKQSDKTVFDKVMSVGWTKAKELIHVVTRESVDLWVDKATNMSVETLRKEVKLFLKTIMPTDDEKKVLDNISNVEGTPAEEATRTMNITFTYQDFVTLSEALDRVKSSHVSDSNIGNGAAIALICADYLASNPVEGEDGRKFLIQSMIKYENLADVQLVVIDRRAEEVLYGADVLVDFIKGRKGVEEVDDQDGGSN